MNSGGSALSGLRKCLLVCIFVILLSGQIGIYSEFAYVDQKSNIDSNPASLVITNYIEDPDFTIEPEVVIEGTSEEFSAGYHKATDENDFNYVELTWDHTANSSLNFLEVPEYPHPDCLDFIYVYQEFDWLYNDLPRDVGLQVNFSSNLSGSFATEDEAGLMFKLYVWLIDSSGHWITIYESYPPYVGTYQEHRRDLNFFDMHEAFSGMIENATGYQLDPDDTLQIAIGLAPTLSFEEYSGTSPWEFYNGTVSIKINRIELYGYMDAELDPSLYINPLYNSTWVHFVSEIFPDAPEELENSTNWFEDMTIAPDGSIYILTKVSPSYEYYASERKYFSYQYVLKYTPELELVWAKHNQNDTYGYGIAFHNGYIYTTGKISDRQNTRTADFILTKWSSNGDIIWEKQWGDYCQEIGKSIGVSSDGSIYVWAEHWDYWQQSDSFKSSLLKFNPSGALLWNKTFDFLSYSAPSRIQMQKDGFISWNGAIVEKRDYNGKSLWTIDQKALAFNLDGDGNIYISDCGLGSGTDGKTWQYMLSKWDADGAKIWQSNHTFIRNDGLSWNFTCKSIDVTPDGSIIALLHGSTYSYDYHLIKFDTEGTLLWDNYIGDEHWPYSGAREPLLEIGDNGIAYFGFTRLGDFRYEVAVSAFIVGPITTYTPKTDPSFIAAIIAVTGVTIGIIVIVIYVRKYR